MQDGIIDEEDDIDLLNNSHFEHTPMHESTSKILEYKYQSQMIEGGGGEFSPENNSRAEGDLAQVVLKSVIVDKKDKGRII